MKKLLLTAVVALSTLAASAQFMVVTTYDSDQEETMDKLTANLGIGFQISDGITIGAVRSLGSTTYNSDSTGAPTDTVTTEDGYEIFLRYNLSFMDGMYATLQAPTDDFSGNMRVGLGISFNVWNSLYIEPNYSLPVSKDDNDEREGTFKIGIGYRF